MMTLEEKENGPSGYKNRGFTFNLLGPSLYFKILNRNLLMFLFFSFAILEF